MKTTDKCGGERRAAQTAFALLLGGAACHDLAPLQTFNYPEQTLPLVLPADSNDHEYGCRFAMSRAGWLRVHCTGEVMPSGPLVTQDLDHVALYFDLGNQKRKAFGDGDDYQYAITRLPAKLVVQPANQANRLQYAFAEKGATKWYEVQVPWASLKYRPSVDRTFGFDCTATDDDTHQKDRILCWHAKDAEGFLNTALYGNLVLQSRVAATSVGTVGCAYAVVAPVLDGRVDSIWQRLPAHPIVSRVYGSHVEPENFAAQFRTCWN